MVYYFRIGLYSLLTHVPIWRGKYSIQEANNNLTYLHIKLLRSLKDPAHILQVGTCQVGSYACHSDSTHVPWSIRRTLLQQQACSV
jgi:hypothetical protein